MTENIAVVDVARAVRRLLETCSACLVETWPSLKIGVSEHSNSSIPCRIYLSIFERTSGNELAISVDMKLRGSDLLIDSDICLDEGRVLAEGPTCEVDLGGGRGVQNHRLQVWLADFDEFLSAQSDLIQTEVEKLRTRPS